MSRTLASAFHAVLAYARLVRPLNSLALGLLFWGSSRFYGPSPHPPLMAGRALSWVILASCAYAYNDVVDVEIDAINRPRRVLPSGQLSIETAKRLTFNHLVAAIVTVAGVWRSAAPLPLLVFAATFLYSSFLRQRSAFAANTVASLTIAMVPLTATLSDRVAPAWFLAAGIFLVMFARETQKDAMDRAGDEPYRTPGLLNGEHAKLFRALYPFGLAIGALFIWLGTSRPGMSWDNLGPGAVCAILAACIYRNARHQGDHTWQAKWTKLASYVIVGTLLYSVGGTPR